MRGLLKMTVGSAQGCAYRMQRPLLGASFYQTLSKQRLKTWCLTATHPKNMRIISIKKGIPVSSGYHQEARQFVEQWQNYDSHAMASNRLSNFCERSASSKPKSTSSVSPLDPAPPAVILEEALNALVFLARLSLDSFFCLRVPLLVLLAARLLFDVLV